MFARTFRILVASALLACIAPHAYSRSATAAEETELRRMTQELLDAIAPGHVEVWQRYLHERMTHVDETDTVRNKAELLDTLQPLPKGLVGSIAIDSFKAEIEGDVAFVTHEDQEHLDYFGQVLRSRFRSTDTWLRTADGWRLFGEHTMAVLKDPPSIALTPRQLCEYNGSYALTPDIVANVRCEQDGLTVERTGRPAAKYFAEAPDVFFAAGQPRTRRIFVRDAAGRIVGFVDRREGEDVRWTKQS